MRRQYRVVLVESGGGKRHEFPVITDSLKEALAVLRSVKVFSEAITNVPAIVWPYLERHLQIGGIIYSESADIFIEGFTKDGDIRVFWDPEDEEEPD